MLNSRLNYNFNNNSYRGSARVYVSNFKFAARIWTYLGMPFRQQLRFKNDLKTAKATGLYKSILCSHAVN